MVGLGLLVIAGSLYSHVQGHSAGQRSYFAIPDAIDPRNHYFLDRNVNSSTPTQQPSSNRTQQMVRLATPIPTSSTGALLCAPGHPCIDGSCCGLKNICGFGPDYCSKGCQSSCQAKAPCGANSEGGSQSCGMRLCCSAMGWCGATEDYCSATGPEPCQARFGGCAVKQPFQCDPKQVSATKRSIGYYQGSNVYSGRVCNQIAPGDISLDSYTHLYWAFAEFDPVTFSVVAADHRDEALYPWFTVLRITSKVKTWISIGGFDFTTNNLHAWSDMVSTSVNRQAFINSLINFMNLYGFQGVDLDWEYPVDDKRGGRLDDMKNLVQLLAEMRAHPKFGNSFGISVALAPDIYYLQHFDAKGLLRSADFLGFMSYDLHGVWDKDVPRIGNVVLGQTNIHDIDRNLTPLWFGVDAADMQRINFGLALYGRGYTLADPACNRADGTCYFSGGNKPGPCTNEAGIMSLTEIQALIEKRHLEPTPLGDGTTMMKQLVWDDQWLGYDDFETYAQKLDYANRHCFGGTMAWSVDLNSGNGRASAPPISTDGTCGVKNGKVCPDGQCCSFIGNCGTTVDHCGAGCYSGACSYGDVTNNGQCGVGNNDLGCGGSYPGCCSVAGWCQPNFQCGDGEQYDYSSDDFDDTNLGPEPPLSKCTDSYATTDDLGNAASAGKVPLHCQAIYVVETLYKVLSTSLDDYKNYLAEGYDKSFQVYAQAVVDNAGTSVYNWITKNGKTYFTCVVAEIEFCCDFCNSRTGNNPQTCQYCFEGECYETCPIIAGCPPKAERLYPPPSVNLDRVQGRDGGPSTGKVPKSQYEKKSEPCPPDYSKRGWGTPFPNGLYTQTVWWTLPDTNAARFYTDLAAETAVPKERITFQDLNRRGNQCNPGAHPDDKCWYGGMDYNMPAVSGYTTSDVTDPKKLVEAAMASSTKLLDQVSLARDMLRSATFFGDPTDLVDSISLPVLMIVQAVESMKNIVDTANEITAEKEKAIILAFFGALLFLVPIAGQILGTIESLADIAAIVTAFGIAGNTAMDIYNIVEDKDNPLLAIFSLVLEPLALTDVVALAKASNIRRGMAETDVAKLGEKISTSLGDIQKVTGVCNR